jgi:hypothetical protein
MTELIDYYEFLPAGFITASICDVRDFEKLTCQNSCEPNMRLDTNLAFFIN